MSHNASDQLVEITLADITFIQQLKQSESSCIFQVSVHGKICVMKVYHAIERSHADPPGREIDIFLCESNAYRRLKMKGLCQRGVIPDFYGVIENIDPTLGQPHLDPFLKDKLRPNAVLIEYIPNIRQIDLSTFSETRIARLRAILDEIHQAWVYHGDPYLRNMMVQEDSDRVMWIDFDRAQILSENGPTPRQQQWMKEEDEMMDYFVEALTADYKVGIISRTWPYYYEYV
ncbi:hypothetical protein VTN77DRAFT_8472 [Rasamsonia byssochlamydoides]|uniref:uncharacterized protein n=1 Tax=Rasamsonia byssochlamydoides TaxID=89139 RepID=UPI0037432F96